jgi:hypothetical protein
MIAITIYTFGTFNASYEKKALPPATAFYCDDDTRAFALYDNGKFTRYANIGDDFNATFFYDFSGHTEISQTVDFEVKQIIGQYQTENRFLIIDGDNNIRDYNLDENTLGEVVLTNVIQAFMAYDTKEKQYCFGAITNNVNGENHGDLYTWGANTYGQLGISAELAEKENIPLIVSVTHPVKVMENVKKTLSNGFVTLVLNNSGEVFECGISDIDPINNWDGVEPKIDFINQELTKNIKVSGAEDIYLVGDEEYLCPVRIAVGEDYYQWTTRPRLAKKIPSYKWFKLHEFDGTPYSMFALDEKGRVYQITKNRLYLPDTKEFANEEKVENFRYNFSLGLPRRFSKLENYEELIFTGNAAFSALVAYKNGEICYVGNLNNSPMFDDNLKIKIVYGETAYYS